jgi:hypothetical protein
MSDNICIRKEQNNIHLWIHALVFLTMCTGIGSSRLHIVLLLECLFLIFFLFLSVDERRRQLVEALPSQLLCRFVDLCSPTAKHAYI